MACAKSQLVKLPVICKLLKQSMVNKIHLIKGRVLSTLQISKVEERHLERGLNFYLDGFPQLGLACKTM